MKLPATNGQKYLRCSVCCWYQIKRFFLYNMVPFLHCLKEAHAIKMHTNCDLILSVSIVPIEIFLSYHLCLNEKLQHKHLSSKIFMGSSADWTSLSKRFSHLGTILKNSHLRHLSPGFLGEKRKRSLCATLPNLMDTYH